MLKISRIVMLSRFHYFASSASCAVAGDKAVANRSHGGRFIAAAFRCIGTPRMKPAAGRRVYRTWQFARKKRLFLKARGGISLGYGIDEKARIRVQRRGVNLIRGPDLA